MAIVGFLKTATSKNDLATALSVIREFKEHESAKEWLMISFSAWAKLEQLQEFLEHLCEGKELQQDTLEEIERQRLNPDHQQT